MMKKFNQVFYLLLLASISVSQDRNYLQKISNILSSKKYAGRGYTFYPNEKEIGIEKSRKFIIREISKIGAYDLQEYVRWSDTFTKSIKFSKIHFQKKIKPPQLEITANNISYTSLIINGKTLILGRDYLPDASSKSVDFDGSLMKIDSVHFINQENGIILKLVNKLMYSSSQEQSDVTTIYIRKDIIEQGLNKIDCKLKVQVKLQNIKTDNIYAFIPGILSPDTFIVFSAHYDHLGNIDTTYFPGANDNASGVAVLLDFMRYFKKHPIKYSVAFYFFTGEEIGLLGSEYYVKYPLFDLKRIKFLINLDLMGGGSEGIMVVNGKIFQKELKLLEQVNKDKELHLTIKSRPKAKNSDHYWFTEKGVKSFFIYTMGDIKVYHNIDDKSENLKFTNYNKFFVLITNWVSSMINDTF